MITPFLDYLYSNSGMIATAGCQSDILVKELPRSVRTTSNAELRQKVVDAERAFAATMQARDHSAFTRFIADE
jgi:hypothetical protein